MAYPVTLNGRTYTLADFEGTNYVDGFPDALEDFVTQAGNIYTTTSTSSVAIGTGSKTFTVADSGKPYIVGTPLRIADSAAPSTNWIDGIVTSYSGTTLVVNAVAYAGSGTISSWNINIGGGPIAYTGTLPIAQGGTGATTAADARTNLDTYSKAEADSRFLNVSGEASDVVMNGSVTIGDSAGDTLTVNATATMADVTLTTADINGGTIDNTVIGGTTPAAISGTTGTFSGDLTVDTNTLYVDSTNNSVGIGTSSPSAELDVTGSGNVIVEITAGSDTNTSNIFFGDQSDANAGYILYDHSDDSMSFRTNGTGTDLTIDSSGNFLVGTTDSTPSSTAGVAISGGGYVYATRSSDPCGLFNRLSTDGDVINIRKDGTTVGTIGVELGRTYIASDNGSTGSGVLWGSNGMFPTNRVGTLTDNTYDVGSSNYRWDDVYATNGTIQTSDRNEKQDIEALSDAEQRVAVACKGLIRKYRWKDAVVEKGDKARIHVGIIAQDLQDAFAAEGLDAGRYAMFTSGTWWEADEVIPAVEEVLDEDGNVVTEAQPERTVTNTYETLEEAPEGATERTRLGVRYPELLAFIIGAL